MTLWDMVTKPSQALRNHRVRGLSNQCGSWGMTLSSTGTTLQRAPACRATQPSDGANHDIQYFMTRRSGPQARMARAVFPQEKGFTVSSRASASTGTASSSGVTYCVFPGKRISGYCLLKE